MPQEISNHPHNDSTEEALDSAMLCKDGLQTKIKHNSNYGNHDDDILSALNRLIIKNGGETAGIDVTTLIQATEDTDKATFYRHFGSLGDLLQRNTNIISGAIKEIAKESLILEKDKRFNNFSRKVRDHIKENHIRYEIEYNRNSTAAWKKAFENDTVHRLITGNWKISSSSFYDYAYSYYRYLFIAAVNRWLENYADPYANFIFVKEIDHLSRNTLRIASVMGASSINDTVRKTADKKYNS